MPFEAHPLPHQHPGCPSSDLQPKAAPAALFSCQKPSRHPLSRLRDKDTARDEEFKLKTPTVIPGSLLGAPSVASCAGKLRQEAGAMAQADPMAAE